MYDMENDPHTFLEKKIPSRVFRQGHFRARHSWIMDSLSGSDWGAGIVNMERLGYKVGPGANRYKWDEMWPL